MCFDTEFVGEKRFVTRLCLIQVTTINGNYLIDPFYLKSLDPFLDLIQDPGITKITHAGENDYRLLFNQYKITPNNIFDTQIAAGLVGYRYPISFRKLVEQELALFLKKGYAVTDWESRPFKKKQLKYALNDVLPLFDLWQSLKRKLEKRARLSWAEEEFSRLTMSSYYTKNPHQEALNSNIMKSLNKKERVFLIRLFQWRREMAKKKDFSKEMVLPSKFIGQITRSIPSGKDALFHNRRLPEKIVRQYGNIFTELYQRAITKEEAALLSQIPEETTEDPKGEILVEMLYLMIKYKCLKMEVAPGMFVARNVLNKIKADPKELDYYIKSNWRREMLGEVFWNWLQHFDQLDIEMGKEKIELKLKSQI